MTIDLDSLPNSAPLAADVCIIGTGPAGIALALEFVGSQYPHVQAGPMHNTVTGEQTLRSRRGLGGPG